MNAVADFFSTFATILWESFQTLLPIIVFFILFQLLYLKLPRRFLAKVFNGLVISFLGLALFLFGVEYGFEPAGTYMGNVLGELPYSWVIIPIGFLLGFMVTLVEPAVRVLSYEVDKTSSGHIPEKIVLYFLALAVALALALGMARIIYGFPIEYLIVPGYVIILLLLKFTSGDFTSIAFDAGGVATGPMVTTFVVAIALGAAEVIKGRDPILDGFGIIAMVAMVPILVIMILGVFYERGEEVN